MAEHFVLTKQLIVGEEGEEEVSDSIDIHYMHILTITGGGGYGGGYQSGGGGGGGYGGGYGGGM